jgi:hypothetical protein
MSESNLTTAEYLEHMHEAREAMTADGSIAASPPAPAAGACDRVASRLSLVVGVALAVSVTVLAIGYLTAARDHVSARAKKSTHPIDWLLWFGGAKEDQTFEKFVKDNSAKSKQEWDEKYRNSPAYQVDPEQMDWRRGQWKFAPAPSFAKPERPSR